MVEEWKPVKGFEGYYEVSNQGNVRSIDRIARGRWGDQLFKGVQLKLQTNHKGYKTVMLHKNSDYYSKTVHRLVAEAFIPNEKTLSK